MKWVNSMDTLDIEYFLQVASHLNFSKAAEVLFVSQSAISKRIHSLEKELGITLFNRNKRYVELTEGGKRLKKFLEKVKKDFSTELSIIRKIEHNENRTIKIGVIQEWNISKYISKFHDASFLDYKIGSDKINFLLRGMIRKEFDLIIGVSKGIKQAIEAEKLDNITVVDLIQVQRIAYLRREHPLANKENISLKDLKDYTLFMGKSKVAKENVDQISLIEGIEFKREPTSNTETIILKVLSSDGFALGCDFSRVKSDTELKYFYINHFQNVGVAYLNDIAEEKLNYVKEIIDIFRNYSKME